MPVTPDVDSRGVPGDPVVRHARASGAGDGHHGQGCKTGPGTAVAMDSLGRHDRSSSRVTWGNRDDTSRPRGDRWLGEDAAIRRLGKRRALGQADLAPVQARPGEESACPGATGPAAPVRPDSASCRGARRTDPRQSLRSRSRSGRRRARYASPARAEESTGCRPLRHAAIGIPAIDRVRHAPAPKRDPPFPRTSAP